MVTSLLLASLVGCARWEFQTRRATWAKQLRTQAQVACRTHLGEAHGQEPCAGAYREGWTEGYREVLAGGAGEPPVVPPERFWSPKARHSQSAQELASWRGGFIDGAATAHACGQKGYGTVPASAPLMTPQPFEQIYTAANFATLSQPWQETEMHSRPSPPLPPMPMPLPPIPERIEGGLPKIQDSDDLLPSPSDQLPSDQLPSDQLPSDQLPSEYLPGGLEPGVLQPNRFEPEVENSDLRGADSNEPFDELDLLSQTNRPRSATTTHREAHLDQAFVKLRNASQAMRSGASVVRIAETTGPVATPSRRPRPLPPATSPWSHPATQLR